LSINQDALYSSGLIGDVIISALARFPDRIAFVSDEKSLTYRETAQAISRASQWLKSKGLQRGDTVVQLCRNSPEQWIVVAALYIAGLRSVNLHPLGSAADHQFIINDSDAKVVIVDEHFAKIVPTYRANCTEIRVWACHGLAGGLVPLWQEAEAFMFSRLKATSSAEDIVRLAYTGGTTGKPKGVMLSNRALVANILMSLAESDWPSEVRLLCVTPITHGAGNMIAPTLMRGGTIYIHKSFDKEAFLRAVERDKITVMFAVPTLLYALLDYEPTRTANLSSLRLIMYGGAPMASSRIKEALALFGPVMCQRYGQTEAPSSITCLKIIDHDYTNRDLTTSCGRPFPGVQVALLDDSGQPVKEGQVGEVCVRGPIVMSGYWKQPQLTEEVFRHGWLHTGDMASEDSEGFLSIVGRKKDMVISGGFNVYPREIEDVLTSHPDVASAAVIGIPDVKWGEAVVAFVQLRAGRSIDAEMLTKWVRERKGPVNTPKRVTIIDNMPITGLGKPDKQALREFTVTQA
jgi:fatty-acyl-CoA synthase